MKFSTREVVLIEFMARHAGQEFSADELMKHMHRKIKDKPQFFRQSVLTSLSKLKLKLSIYGIDLVTVSPIGRGHKAIYYIDGRISTLIS
jgi:hypothetical protein